MSMLNEKPAVGVTVAIVLLAASGLMLWRNAASGGSAPKAAYYWDLSSGKLITAPIADQPPAGAAMARVYTCGACTDDQMQVLMIEKMTDEARRLAQSQTAIDPDATASDAASGVQAQLAAALGTLVAEPPKAGAEPQWIVKGTPAAVPIEMRFLTLCNGERAKACNP
jgi:hypothetical protein